MSARLQDENYRSAMRVPRGSRVFHLGRYPGQIFEGLPHFLSRTHLFPFMCRFNPFVSSRHDPLMLFPTHGGTQR